MITNPNDTNTVEQVLAALRELHLMPSSSDPLGVDPVTAIHRLKAERNKYVNVAMVLAGRLVDATGDYGSAKVHEFLIRQPVSEYDEAIQASDELVDGLRQKIATDNQRARQAEAAAAAQLVADQDLEARARAVKQAEIDQGLPPAITAVSREARAFDAQPARRRSDAVGDSRIRNVVVRTPASGGFGIGTQMAIMAMASQQIDDACGVPPGDL